jgi:hypothetical protein
MKPYKFYQKRFTEKKLKLQYCSSGPSGRIFYKHNFGRYNLSSADTVFFPCQTRIALARLTSDIMKVIGNVTKKTVRDSLCLRFPKQTS